jgi:hypothetical protein
MELKTIFNNIGHAKWAAVVVALAGSLHGWARSRDVVLLLNAHYENQTCLKHVYLYPDSDPHPNEESTCIDREGDAQFLRQGRRTELRVFNRRFLTDYTLTVDAVTSIQTGPNIRNLSEAENLTFAAPSFAAPVAKGGAEGLSPRTANTILFELLDETTASKPESDLRADFAVLDREHERLVEELRAFRKTYRLLRGNPSAAPDPTICRKIAGAPDAENIFRCLNAEFQNELDAPWDGVGPYSDEEEFREVITRVQDLIAAVKALRTALANSDLLQKELKLETDVAQFENDLVTFRGNVEAAHDASELAQEMNDAYRQRLSKDRMKTILTDKLKAQGDTKPIVDESEINELVNKYAQSGRAYFDVRSRRWSDLKDTAEGYLQDEYLSQRPLTSEFHAEVASARQKLGAELPGIVDQVNAEQSKLLARVNEIYDNSAVLEPLSKQIDLSGHPGNLVVYYTIRRVEAFSRYTVTPVQGLGAVVPASTAGMALPPPAKGTSPAGGSTTAPSPSTPAATPTSTSTSGPSGTAPAPDTSTGMVVARGQFEVHDIYDANVVAAFAFSTLKDQSISKQAQPQACQGSATAPDTNCFAPVLSSNLRQFQPIVGVDYYFHHMDTFPGHHCTNDMWQCLGIMGAVSVRKADSYYVGIFVEPVVGVQFAGGANIGSQTTLQSAYKFGTPVDLTADFPTYEKRATGAFFSAGLDLAIFRKIFGKVTGLGTATANTQGK